MASHPHYGTAIGGTLDAERVYPVVDVAGDAFEKRARLLREACSRQQISGAISGGNDWRARKDVDSLFLEKMLRASVLASAAPVDETGLASLYEAVLAAAESRREDDGVCLVAAQVLVSIHSLDRLLRRRRERARRNVMAR